MLSPTSLEIYRVMDMGLIQRFKNWRNRDSIRIAGTGGMTLKELKLHRKKSLATICQKCRNPHSLRMTSGETLTCVECGHEQSSWNGEN
jgi:hypothetical protein